MQIEDSNAKRVFVPDFDADYNKKNLEQLTNQMGMMTNKAAYSTYFCCDNLKGGNA